MKNTKCPLCKGFGKVNPREKRSLVWKERMVVKLRRMGFTFHEIMRALEYKSPNSISKILKKYE